MTTNDRKPTHWCKVCGAHWRLNPPSDVQPEGSWSWVPQRDDEPLGKCCDNREMGDQIAPIAEKSGS